MLHGTILPLAGGGADAVATHGQKTVEKKVDELSSEGSSNAYSCYVVYCPAGPPRRNKAVIHGMELSFRGRGLVWLHAQSTVYIQLIKRAIDVSTEP